jgi:benzoate/toluate 1,2-dioxygenase reductase subunit
MPDRHRISCVFEDGRTVVIGADESDTLYAAALRQGVRLLTDCREGACATCFARCVSGSYWHGDISDEALGDEAANGGVLPCQLHLTSDCVLEFPYALDDAGQEQILGARVAAIAPVARDVVRLVLTASAPLDFLPGQYVRIAVPETGASRAYSMANRPGASELEFFVRLLPDGIMSNWLRQTARPGDQVGLVGPFGRFFLRPPAGKVVMVAGGTGLAPMIAMLESMAAQGLSAGEVALLYGTNRQDELFGIDRVRALAPHASIRLSVVQPESGWTGAPGFVTDLLADTAIDGADVYLCGPPAMIDAANARLSGKNCRIFAERFLPA